MGEKTKLCRDCEHFKIVSQPIKGLEMGEAKCTKYNLVVDFIDKRKFKWLSCANRPTADMRGEE